MRFLTSRALSVGRQAITQKPVSFTQRAFLGSAVPAGTNTFRTHVSYKPNPLEKPVNPNKKNKIPYKERPLKQPFTPLPTKTPEQLTKSHNYFIRRTPGSQLPIYRKWMSGGNRVIVIVKKIEGHRTLLVKDLMKALEINKTDIRLNPTTQHVEIKGDHFNKAMEWLLKTGF
ncbi:hypothetical protein FSARC_6020 [Fusarium sarcochroum]|uniref:Large ribosomal subunit protein mL49 n=1 Tax=Fusarium sarcochroum TaxID=1208366 RepID=A0A8H4X8X7_9HYPO|nr:hypothetical protein FSARC_6020 [Fusarium sarcochroum]